MNVLVDIGNTRIKWCVSNKDVVGKVQSIEHAKTNFISLIQQQWFMLDDPKTLAISSVSNKDITKQLAALAKKQWPQVSIVIAKSSSYGYSVTNAYQQANKLGIDRWLGLIALHHYYPGKGCVVDCGTAITIDVLNLQGHHLGGLISPGLQLMKQALFNGTENLSNVENQFPVALSSSTQSAIYSGTLYAAAGLIEKSITDLCKCQTVVLTGGDAILLSQYLNFETIIETDFVLKGLSLYCKEDGVK